MEVFDEKNISPMLIAQMHEPFNDDDWIYELKLDGELVVLRNGVPDFFELQRRTLLTDHFKTEMEALSGIQHSLSL